MKVEYPDILLGQLFPNPPFEDGRVYLACVGNVSEPINVRVMSDSGELVHQSTHCLPGHGGTMKLRLPPLPPGSYPVLVRSGSFSEEREFVYPHPKKETVWGRFSSWLFQ